tara:strand:+ start:119 stop:766 length:648 start_codon:yes stop_codon:yes gene_type:complete
MVGSNLAIIIPAKNEQSTIVKVIENAKNYGQVIVIDDASKDETSKFSKQAGAIVVQNTKTLFYDKTLEHGFNAALINNFKLAITMDADGEHDYQDIPKFKKELDKGYDLVIGQRQSFPRISEKLVNFYFNKRWSLLDPFCGMKGYNLNWYRRFNKFDRYSSIGTDLAIRIIKNHGKFKHIKINSLKRKDKPRFGNIFTANYKIIKSSFLSNFFHK